MHKLVIELILLLSAAATSGLEWSERASMPEPLGAMACSWLPDDRMVAVSGGEAFQLISSNPDDVRLSENFYVYNAPSDRWSEPFSISPMEPVEGARMGFNSDEERVPPWIFLVAGGQRTSNGPVTFWSSQSYLYEEEDRQDPGKFAEGGTLSDPRSFGCIASLEDGRGVFYIGGYDGSSPIADETLQWDNENVRWRAAPKEFDLPAPRASHACVSVSRRAILLGGMTDAADVVADCWLLDADNPAEPWDTKALPDMPSPMQGLAAAYREGTVYTGAGLDRDNRPPETYFRMDIETDPIEWRTLARPPDPFARAAIHACMVTVGRRVFIYGGFDSEMPRYPAQRYVFELTDSSTTTSTATTGPVTTGPVTTGPATTGEATTGEATTGDGNEDVITPISITLSAVFLVICLSFSCAVLLSNQEQSRSSRSRI